MLMDAIIKPAREKGLELVRKEVPTIGMGEALVKFITRQFAGRTYIFTIGTIGRKKPFSRL